MPSPASTVSRASAAHSAIAAKDLAAESTAQTAITKMPVKRCRTPRRRRGSGTVARTSSKVSGAREDFMFSGMLSNWPTSALIGEDETRELLRNGDLDNHLFNRGSRSLTASPGSSHTLRRLALVKDFASALDTEATPKRTPSSKPRNILAFLRNSGHWHGFRLSEV